MTEKRHIPGFVYKLMLLAATIIWGFAFVVMKDAVDVLPPAQLIGVRFFLTGLLMAAVFHRSLAGTLNGPCLKAGLVLAAVTFLAFWVQTVGLADTTPGKNAFLTATYCVIVPFLWWVIARKRPTVFNLGAAVLAVAGIWLVSVTGTGEALTIGFGEGMTLLGALLFAVHIVYVSKFSEKSDVLVLTLLQFAVGGVCGVAYGACFETLPPAESLTPAFWMDMAYLVVFASCVALVIQNVALAHVPPAQASLFLSLESVFGVLFSVLLYGEEIGLRLVGGFALIFVAIVVSETFPLKRKAGADAPALALETPGGPVVSPETAGALGGREADGRAAVESRLEESSWSKSGTT